jgi:cellulose synthase/poly-beta-1,6-N-acetylglucosamine synthase-like glycosyltransferase
VKVVALVPAHNEAASLGAAISALLRQTRPVDDIVVISDNSTDRTYEIAQSFPIAATRTEGNTHKKAGALNAGWANYGRDADLIICVDADTVLAPTAVEAWEREFERDNSLGGSSAKLTMVGDGLLARLQKAEFARWTDTGLRRGWTSVLAGTACAIRNDVLHAVARPEGRDGPWTYGSMVEDFELTYQIRRLGHRCHVSPEVRAYTDAMKTAKALWGQRMKWQVGTVEDLLQFGFNKLTRVDWCQQLMGLLAAFVRVMWVLTMLLAAALGMFQLDPVWLLPTLVFVADDVKQSLRIPHRDTWDVLLAAALLPQEAFAWTRAGWFVASWLSVLKSKVTGYRKDYWSVQYELENSRNDGSTACTVM